MVDRLIFYSIVHAMNRNKDNTSGEVSGYQLDKFQDLIARLFQCCQERMQYQCERFELPDAEFRCLSLFGQERYLTAKSIAHRMNVVKSRVSKIIDGLIKKNLIQRTRDPEDSRVQLLSLNPGILGIPGTLYQGSRGFQGSVAQPDARRPEKNK